LQIAEHIHLKLFFVTWRSVVQATGPYEIENVETDIRGVYTNNTYTAAFRGFGSPQIIFAQESLMDEIAEMGFAAHWKYKGDSSHEGELDKWLKKIREMLEDPNSDALEFLDDFKMNLFRI